MTQTPIVPIVGLLFTNNLPLVSGNVQLSGSIIDSESPVVINPGEIYIEAIFTDNDSYTLSLQFNSSIPTLNLTVTNTSITVNSPRVWVTRNPLTFIYTSPLGDSYEVSFSLSIADAEALRNSGPKDPVGIAMVGTVSTTNNKESHNSNYTIMASDNQGNAIFNYQVPCTGPMNVREIIETAYVVNQTITTSDPFSFSLEYYGYSQDASYPGYLGYELESINSLQTTSDFFWDLAVNGEVSTTGIDTTFPVPGSIITLTYTPVSGSEGLRSKVIRKERAARKNAKTRIEEMLHAEILPG